MRFILITLLIIMLLAPAAQAVNRTVTLEADGRIDLDTASSNENTQAGARIKGDGGVEYSNDTSISRTGARANYQVQGQSSENTLRPLEITTAMITGNGNGGHYIHALQVAPSPGDGASLEVLYDVTTDPFLELIVEAKAVLTGGTFRNYVDIKSPRGLTLREAIRVLGQVYYTETMTITEPEPAAE